MGIFGKFLGKKPTIKESEPPVSVVPEVPKPAAKTEAKMEETRVAARVRISPLHRITFDCHEPRVSAPVGVGNISASGIAFIRSSVPSWPGPSQYVAGQLLIGSKSLGIRARIVHLSTALVGCRYEGEFADLQSSIDDYFQLELTAMKARPINSSILKKDPRGTPHWFMAENNSELYYIENAGRIVHFHLSVFGNYIDGGEGKPTTFGHEQPDSGEELIKRSVLIHTTTDLPPDVVQGSLRFLESIEMVPGDVRTQILGMIRR